MSVVGIGALDGLAQPCTDRKLAKSQGQEGQEERKDFSVQGWNVSKLRCIGDLPKTPTSRSEPPPPMSQKRPTETLVVDHITLLGFVLISPCCVAKLGIVHQSVPAKAKRLLFTWQTCIWYFRSGLCCMQCVTVLTAWRQSKTPKKINT